MKVILISSIVLLAVRASSLEIVPIKEWSGEETRRTEALQNPVSLVVIQHTVTAECNTDDVCPRLLKSMRNNFLNIGLTDIAYNFMIGGNGKIYEGSGWNLVGAHTKRYNDKSIGIAFIGDFRDKPPTPAALEAALDLLNYGVENKYLSEDYKLVGHRQLSKTISPGDTLQAIIEDWPHWANVQSRRRK